MMETVLPKPMLGVLRIALHAAALLLVVLGLVDECIERQPMPWWLALIVIVAILLNVVAELLRSIRLHLVATGRW